MVKGSGFRVQTLNPEGKVRKDPVLFAGRPKAPKRARASSGRTCRQCRRCRMAESEGVSCNTAAQDQGSADCSSLVHGPILFHLLTHSSRV